MNHMQLLNIVYNLRTKEFFENYLFWLNHTFFSKSVKIFLLPIKPVSKLAQSANIDVLELIQIFVIKLGDARQDLLGRFVLERELNVFQSIWLNERCCIAIW